MLIKGVKLTDVKKDWLTDNGDVELQNGACGVKPGPDCRSDKTLCLDPKTLSVFELYDD